MWRAYLCVLGVLRVNGSGCQRGVDQRIDSDDLAAFGAQVERIQVRGDAVAAEEQVPSS
jgi:hypothetical protein